MEKNIVNMLPEIYPILFLGKQSLQIPAKKTVDVWLHPRALRQCAILKFLFYAAFAILNIQFMLSKHKVHISSFNPHNTLVPASDIFTDKQKALFLLF